MINQMSNFGLFFETALVIFLSYITGLQIALGTRAIASPHFAIPAFTYFVVELMYDEVRKIYVRKGIKRVGDKIVYEGWLARNSIW